MVDFFTKPGRFKASGARVPKGVLLCGPPGTGKTLLARAVAGEARVAFLSLNASEFVEMFAGLGASRVRDLFSQVQPVTGIFHVDLHPAPGKHARPPCMHRVGVVSYPDTIQLRIRI